MRFSLAPRADKSQRPKFCWPRPILWRQCFAPTSGACTQHPLTREAQSTHVLTKGTPTFTQGEGELKEPMYVWTFWNFQGSTVVLRRIPRPKITPSNLSKILHHLAHLGKIQQCSYATGAQESHSRPTLGPQNVVDPFTQNATI